MSDLPTFKSTGFQHLDASIERAIEQAYKLGFDAGIEHQRKASPPPKARELAKQLEAVTAERDKLAKLVAPPCRLERELAELEATDPTIAAARAKLDQVAAELVSPPLTLRSGNPIHILSDAKRAAIKADWPLRKWVEVSTSFRSCFSPDAVAGEAEKALEVLGSHFTVTLAPGFRFDPKEWSHDQQSGP